MLHDSAGIEVNLNIQAPNQSDELMFSPQGGRPITITISTPVCILLDPKLSQKFAVSLIESALLTVTWDEENDVLVQDAPYNGWSLASSSEGCYTFAYEGDPNISMGMTITHNPTGSPASIGILVVGTVDAP
jgi:hypothetical protein